MAPRRSWFARQRAVLGASLADAGWSLGTRRAPATLSSIGIAASITGVVLLVSVADGLKRFALENIASAGGNVIVVAAVPETTIGAARNLPAMLRAGDERAVLSASTAFDLASAENSISLTVAAGDRSVSGLETRGITSAGFAILQLRPAAGRLLREDDHTRGTRAAVLGAEVAASLFDDRSPLGATIMVGEWPFVVVGVLSWVGDPDAGLRSGLDATVFVPFRAAADAFHGDDAAAHLRLRLHAPAAGPEAAAEARAALDRQMRQRGERGGELRVTNTIDRMRLFSRLIIGLNVLVGVVGGLGLAVGAIGVANVLTASVRERSVEIGVRRAFGATRTAVFTGFLLEALAITVSGGVVGLLVAWAISSTAILFPQVPASARPEVTGATGIAAVVVLVFVGLIAGVAPARRAAAVYPAEALRSE